MRFKCIKDYDTVTRGIFNKTTHDVHIEGLTDGKVYEGTIVSEVSGQANIGCGAIECAYHALIFNDNNEWDTYLLELFEPVT